MKSRRIFGALVVSFLGACGSAGNEQELPQLRKVFSDHFMIGAALGTDRVLQQHDPALQIVSSQCNAITAENLLKWESVHPHPDEYDFAPVDKFVDYGEANKMFIVGHVLVWHSQVPDWVFQDDSGKPLGKQALLDRMRDHIHTVVGRYKGRIHAWDVVNEALEDDGSLRDTAWRQAIGDDYLINAFRFAQKADPDAELFYNDYSMFLPGKRAAAARLIKHLQASGCRIDGIGLQGHWRLEHPTLEEAEEALQVYGRLGIKLLITELDINVLPRSEGPVGADVRQRGESSAEINPYVDGLPEEVQNALAERYADLFKLFLRHPKIGRVTFWGVDDGHSWHNGWPIPGRTAHSLLFDRSFRPKPAFWSVIETAKTH